MCFRAAVLWQSGEVNKTRMNSQITKTKRDFMRRMTKLTKSLIIRPCLFVPQTIALRFLRQKHYKPWKLERKIKLGKKVKWRVDGLLNPGGLGAFVHGSFLERGSLRGRSRVVLLLCNCVAFVLAPLLCDCSVSAPHECNTQAVIVFNLMRHSLAWRCIPHVRPVRPIALWHVSRGVQHPHTSPWRHKAERGRRWVGSWERTRERRRVKRSEEVGSPMVRSGVQSWSFVTCSAWHAIFTAGAARLKLFCLLHTLHVSLYLPLIGFNERFNNAALPDQIKLLPSTALNPGSLLSNASVSQDSPFCKIPAASLCCLTHSLPPVSLS